jgi:WD40 repeat protein
MSSPSFPPFHLVSSVHLSLNYLSPSYITHLRSCSFKSSFSSFPYPLHQTPHQANPLIPACSPASSDELLAVLTTDSVSPSISLYTCSPVGLIFVHSLKGHQRSIQSTCFHYHHPRSQFNQPFPYLLVSGDDGGSVRLWDTRTAKNVHSLNLPNRLPALSLQLFGSDLIIGSDSLLMNYDTRTMKLVKTFDEFFTGDVLNLSVHPISGHLFTCGAECSVNEVNIKQEENPVMTFVCESEIERIGFFGDSTQYLYCLSSTQGLSVFDLTSDAPVMEKPNIRVQLAQQAGIHIDYLLNVQEHEEEKANSFTLAAGNNNGSIAVMEISASELKTRAVMLSESKVE